MRWSSSCVIMGRAMNSRVASLSQQYTSALQDYLDSQQEILLQQAYELGRIAIAGQLGLLDIAQIHQRALLECLLPACSMEEKQRILQASETFFLEALSPFEATHRGFRNANLRLQELNETLECRGAELTAINYDLHELSNRILHVQERGLMNLRCSFVFHFVCEADHASSFWNSRDCDSPGLLTCKFCCSTNLQR